MRDIRINTYLWESFLGQELIYDKELPSAFKVLEDINHIQLIQILQPDQVIPLIQLKIQNFLGKQFIEFESFNIESFYQTTKNNVPIIFILSQGAEPLPEIERL
jgi:hypothetical protein